MKKILIIDCGHGGRNPNGEYVTPGKRSPLWSDGTIYYEGIGNRQIGLKVANRLIARGWSVFYTVNPRNYNDISLDRRARIANDIYSKYPQAILVSIHSNGHSNTSANGYEVYTSPGQTKSDKIADVWIHEFGKLFPGLKRRVDTRDGDLDKEAKFRILTKTKCPAILIESMFHTNKKECDILLSECGKEKIAQSIINTLIKF